MDTATDALPRLLLLFTHLLATCVALGALISTDTQLLRRIGRADFRLSPPNPMVMTLIGAALIVCCATGALLVMEGLRQRPGLLLEPKLQAKVGLVVLLIANAFALHAVTFRRLSRGKRVKPRSASWAVGVALPIAVSHALWLYIAFLGIARPWNYKVSQTFVVTVAVMLVLVAWVATMVVLVVAQRRQLARRRAARPSSPLPLSMLGTGPVPLDEAQLSTATAYANVLAAIRPTEDLANPLVRRPLLQG
jgi:hypothetical protein